MGIALKVFVVYMIVFLLMMWRDHKKGKKARGRAYYLVPIGALVVIVLLSVLKIFIVYKIIILLVSLVAVTLTYWHYRKR
ncbi:MAG: hypothetical protein FWG14_02750 [Peptococcaceae bacterium]|nr:hypothetical protein [Peptococcaceae bacterium]